MHELAITEAVVAGVCERVGAQRVLRVVLEVGRLTAVVPDALRFCFDVSTRGTAADGAVLDIVEVPAVGECRNCGIRGELNTGCFSICPACGAAGLAIVSGEELRVKAVEVAT